MSWAPPKGHYPGYLRIEDVWVPVHRISANPQVEFDRPVVIERTLSGRRRAQIGPTTHRDWSVRLGLSTPENLALWERLLTGGYGLGPFEWVDPWDNAAAGGGEPFSPVVEEHFTWTPLGNGQIQFDSHYSQDMYYEWSFNHSPPWGQSGHSPLVTFPSEGAWVVLFWAEDGSDTYSQDVDIVVTPGMMGPPVTSRPVILSSLTHAPRHISDHTKITAITITLSEVGTGE